MRPSITRREALRAVVFVGAAVALTRSVFSRGSAKVFPSPASDGALSGGALPSGAPAPTVATIELAPGERVARCSVVSVGPVEKGGVSVILRGRDGRDFSVDVLRHDPRAPGVARAGSLAVYMKNGGTGATATDEDQGLGAMALAALLARREAAGSRVPELYTLRQRVPLITGPG